MNPKPPYDFYTTEELQSLIFPPLQEVVSPIIAEGVTLFAGREKIGKSWLALDMALAVATGANVAGDWTTGQGDVLVLALEDGQRRMQRRLSKLAPGGAWPSNLTVSHSCPRLNDGFREMVLAWTIRSSNPKLVIVDTLQLCRPFRPSQKYQDDTADMQSLKAISDELNVSIVCIHHLRKAAAEDDPFDAVSGSTGLAAGADATIILKRHASLQGFECYSRGRDVAETEIAMSFDKSTCRWKALGHPSEAFRSSEKNEVIEALRELGEAGPKQLSEILGTSEDAMKKRLGRMANKGELTKVGRGIYAAPPVTSVPASLFEENAQ